MTSYTEITTTVSFHCFRADVIDYGNAFNLTKYLTNETEYIVWDRVASSIAYVRNMLSGNGALYPKFQVRELLILPCVHISNVKLKNSLTLKFICDLKYQQAT